MGKFKNWKSELKKKGAMALTAFMLCGSAGTAFAEYTEDIVINDGDEYTLGNEKTITGYQTDEAVGYAAKITWGDMLFVYDRGTYDPISGKLVGSFQDNDSEYSREDIEINGYRTEAGYWYGFDGENNAVKIENLSTESVKLTATTKVTRTQATDVKFSLYVSSNTNTWTGTNDVNGSNGGVKHDILSGEDVDKGTWKIGTSGGEISRVFNAREFDNNGESATTDSDVIYLNITGKPDDDFMTESEYNKSNPQVGEELGTITLNFTMENGNDLDEVSGD